MGCVCGKEYIFLQDNKYYIKDLIGQGGFSSVYLVEDTNSIKYVLKCIYCHDEKDKEKALKEAEMHSIMHDYCNNNYIIKLMGCQMIEKSLAFSKTPMDSFLMLLPYYKNGSLHDRLTLYQNQINLNKIIEHFRIICLGVKAFHDASYAHRDIKPANILFDDNNKPIIIDLGSAAPARVVITSQKDAQELLDNVNERCSMTYRAPELFNIDINSSIDERIDVWSLGCLLYAMLYGKSPFDLVYERGDSVALAVISGKLYFPPDSYENFNEVIKILLTIDHINRPNINNVLDYINNLEDSLHHNIGIDPCV